MKSQRNVYSIMNVVTVLAFCLLGSFAAFGQPQQLTTEQFAGNYKGTAKMASGEMDLTLEIKSTSGKVTGRAVTSNSEYQISSGEIVGGKLLLKLGTGPEAASLTLEKKEEKLTGDWIRGSEKGTAEFRKVEAPSSDTLSGEWEAVADAQGEAFPFTLSLKLEGEKVTGSSNSQLGPAPISSGNWKNGKLTIVLEGGSGQIALIATMVDGKLSGDYDFAGQMSGKWVAMKKK